MSMQRYGTKPSRNIIRAEMEMIKHAEPVTVLGSFGVQKEQPKRKTDTVVFRRLKPFNAKANETPDITASNFRTAEGVTPDTHTIDYTDVSVTLEQYAVLFKFTSKAELMYEDDIPQDMSKLTGETIAEIAELVAYGHVKSGLSVSYASATASRTSVKDKISIKKLRQAARTMETNRAHKVTECIKPGPNFGTSSVEASYIVFIHTDVVADVRDLPHFTKRTDYGTAIKPVHDREIGECEGFRFVTSPLFAPYLAGGDSVGTSGMLSVGGTKCDVYPCVIMAADAWGHVSLKGKGYTGISPTIIPAGQKNHANPIGMFGYVGADFWYAPVRLNENHMTRLEVAVSDLD